MPELSDREKVEQIAEVIERIGNDWEIGFIENLLDNWTGDYTPNQTMVIERLWKRACESDL